MKTTYKFRCTYGDLSNGKIFREDVRLWIIAYTFSEAIEMIADSFPDDCKAVEPRILVKVDQQHDLNDLLGQPY